MSADHKTTIDANWQETYASAITTAEQAVLEIRPGQRVFVGAEWFEEILSDPRLHASLWRQFLFSGLVLLIEIPLGVLIALAMPTRGWGVSISLVLLALPLLIPWNVIGTIWIIFTRPDIGLFGVTINHLGIAFDHTAADAFGRFGDRNGHRRGAGRLGKGMMNFAGRPHFFSFQVPGHLYGKLRMNEVLGQTYLP